MTPILKVAVVMGGPSGEHDISLTSGQGVTRALVEREWCVEPIVIPNALDVPEARTWARRALEAATPDVAFLALHGPFGEDGIMQQVCEDARIAYTGSDAVASRLGMDKIASRRRFEQAGLAVPRWTTLDLARRQASAPSGFTYPLVVKPISQGSSLGVSIVRDARQLPSALEDAGRYGSQLLVEQFVEGREVTVGILDEAPLPVIEIRPRHAFFDFSAKYTPGSTDYVVPAPLEARVAARVQAAGLTAHRALGCRHLSRVDCILDASATPVVLEINTIPGFTPTSLLPKAAACAGVSYQDLCERLVLMALSDPQDIRAWPSAVDASSA